MRPNRRGHIELKYGLSPVWVRSCRGTWLVWANRRNGTPRSPGPSLGMPPLPVGRTFRLGNLKLELHHNACPPTTPAADVLDRKRRQPILSARTQGVCVEGRAVIPGGPGWAGGTSSKRTASRRCGSARAAQRRSCWRTAEGTSSRRMASRGLGTLVRRNSDLVGEPLKKYGAGVRLLPVVCLLMLRLCTLLT